jgi:cation-transporting ATPase 13A3/4/5
VDEAALSGETMPVQKFEVPVNTDRRNPEEAEHKKYFLYAGTDVLQTGGAKGQFPAGLTDGTLAVVISTGPNTSRGTLIKGLIFGASLRSRLFIELKYSLGILVLIAAIDFLSLSSNFEMSISSMLTAMYSIIGLINPLMAVSLVAGEMLSAKRLNKNKDHKVYTRDLHRVTIAGKVDLALLDKTGTITKSGLDFYGLLAPDTLRFNECTSRHSDIPQELSSALALAHTVTVCNGKMIGHQVELRMVETAQRVGWKFDADYRSVTAPSGKKWIAERLFPFSHETMTMSALVYSDGTRSVICKGSFEALKLRCVGVPPEAQAKADQYAKEGCYVIAVGTRVIKSDQANHELVREEVEKDLKFAGLILFRNELKPDSIDAISELQSAGVAVRMMTGDSVHTGVAVAKTVGMIPKGSQAVIGTLNRDTQAVEWRCCESNTVMSMESVVADPTLSLAVSGEVFALLSLQGKLNLEATRVYGRVSPNQKAEVVKLYTSAGKVVTMCGDGANDSSGLRAAHAGLALSGRTEASISAPFSTDSDSLLSLALLIREARAALCTSLASYQTLVVVGILYCISKSILLFQAAAYQAGLSYLYLDLITTPLMLYSLVHALPSKKLADKAPEGSLFGGQLVLSCMWSIFICIAFLVVADLVMVNQAWFVPFKAEAGIGLEEWQKRGNNFEAALIFIWSAWVYVDVPLAFSSGGIHRAPIYMNWRLILSSAALLAVTLAVLFVPSGEFGCYFKVACDSVKSAEASNAFVNFFLFPYEKVGGTWWNSRTASTEYPTSFKVGLFFILLSMTIAHHVGHYIINVRLTKYIRDHLGWDGSCLRRRKRSVHKEEVISMKVERTTSTDIEFQAESMKTKLRPN